MSETVVAAFFTPVGYYILVTNIGAIFEFNPNTRTWTRIAQAPLRFIQA